MRVDILRIIAEALKTDAEKNGAANEILRALEDAGYVCVPRVPNDEMLKCAWADALAEDPSAVWSSMIAAASHSQNLSR